MRRPIGRRFSPFSRCGQVPSCRTAETCLSTRRNCKSRTSSHSISTIARGSAEIAVTPHTHPCAHTSRQCTPAPRESQNNNSRVSERTIRAILPTWCRVPLVIEAVAAQARFARDCVLLSRNVFATRVC